MIGGGDGGRRRKSVAVHSGFRNAAAAGIRGRDNVSGMRGGRVHDGSERRVHGGGVGGVCGVEHARLHESGEAATVGFVGAGEKMLSLVVEKILEKI